MTSEKRKTPSTEYMYKKRTNRPPTLASAGKVMIIVSKSTLMWLAPFIYFKTLDSLNALMNVDLAPKSL